MYFNGIHLTNLRLLMCQSFTNKPKCLHELCIKWKESGEYILFPWGYRCLTLNIVYCSIRNNWIGHKFHNLKTSSPIHTWISAVVHQTNETFYPTGITLHILNLSIFFCEHFLHCWFTPTNMRMLYCYNSIYYIISKIFFFFFFSMLL
jgi:hypothetical protein